VRLCIARRDESGNLRRGNVSRKFVSGTRGCGHALRPLLEAAAMLILTRHTAGSELEPSPIRGGLAEPRTARMMASWHNVVVRGHLPDDGLSHFPRWMHVSGMHGEHRSHSHLCPGHHGHK